MAYQLDKLAPGNSRTNPLPIDAEELRRRIDDLLGSQAQRFRRLWFYYRNPMFPRSQERDEQGSDRPYRQAQEWGLPSRITGLRASSAAVVGGQPLDDVARKEIVIENDIGWRIDTMIDVLLGQPIKLAATSVVNPVRRSLIESLLSRIFTSNGGQLALQQIGLLGAVYGFVDVLVKLEPAAVQDALNTVHQLTSDATPTASENREELANDGGYSLTSHAEPAPRANDAGVSPPPSAPVSSQTADTSSPSSIDSASVSPSQSDRSESVPDDDVKSLASIARAVRLEVVEPARALPLLSAMDWRDVRAYVQVYQLSRDTSGDSAPPRVTAQRARGTQYGSFLARLGSTAGRLFGSAATRSGALFSADSERVTITEILTDSTWQRYEDEVLVAQGVNSLGQLPLVHIQNLALPFQYSGISDVEQLIPLQDELNTRLSDRANRITMQSFKMYLGKNIDGFTSLPVAPGRMWMTDNPDADVIEFGGDAESTTEDTHVTEIREAMDKISGVSPIAAGTLRDRIGNLTSAAALRVTMMALLAKTRRKQSTYGQAVARICELSLAWLDAAGLYHTTPDERRVEVQWPTPLPDLSS